MAIRRFLFGPDWRSRDPERRLRALGGASDAELLAALPRIAREDPEPRVRLAALKRLDDPRRYLESARDDPDPELRAEARALALRQLAGERPSALSAAQRAEIALEALDDAEAEALLRRAREREVRAALLARVRRESVLIDVAATDPDPELRRAALERIGNAETLERLHRRLRGRDRRLERLAAERLEAMRLAAGDPAAVAAVAERLCRRAEEAVRSPPSDPAALVAEIESAWKALALPEGDPRVPRLAGALATLRRIAERPATGEPRPCEEPRASAGTTVEEPAAVSSAPEPKARPAGAEAPPAEAGQGARELLEELRRALDEGALERAERAAAALRDRPLGREAERRLAPLRARLAELRRWKAWTVREHRERLLAELAGLSGAGLHPDALAERVRELRERWSALHAEAPASPALEGRFRAMLRATLAPARAFFARREALRAERARAVGELIGRAEAALAETGASSGRSAAAAMAVLRRELAAALRRLDELPPRERGALAERLRAALSALDHRRRQLAIAALAHKRELLARLERAASLPPSRASRELERLEQAWRRAGRAPPGDEPGLEERFAAVAARIREAAASAASEQEERARQRAAQAQRLLERLDAGGDGPPLEEVERIARELAGLGELPREVGQRLGQALERAREAALARARAALARELEAALDAAPPGPTSAGDDAEELARRLLVGLEDLAGLESEPEDRELRLRARMERLAARLGGDKDDAVAQARALLARWSALPAAVRTSHRERARRAIAALALRAHPDRAGA